MKFSSIASSAFLAVAHFSALNDAFSIHSTNHVVFNSRGGSGGTLHSYESNKRKLNLYNSPSFIISNRVQSSKLSVAEVSSNLDTKDLLETVPLQEIEWAYIYPPDEETYKEIQKRITDEKREYYVTLYIPDSAVKGGGKAKRIDSNRLQVWEENGEDFCLRASIDYPVNMERWTSGKDMRIEVRAKTPTGYSRLSCCKIALDNIGDTEYEQDLEAKSLKAADFHKSKIALRTLPGEWQRMYTDLGDQSLKFVPAIGSVLTDIFDFFDEVLGLRIPIGELPTFFLLLESIFPTFVKAIPNITAKELALPKDCPTADEDATEIQYSGDFHVKVKSAKLNGLDMTAVFRGRLQSFFPSTDEQLWGKKYTNAITAIDIATILPFNAGGDALFAGSRADAIHAMRELMGALLERPIFEDGLPQWKDCTSDDTMRRIYFSNIGQHFIKATEDGYEADLLYFQNYTPRKGYEAMGNRVLFDKHGKILHIDEPIPENKSVSNPEDGTTCWSVGKITYIKESDGTVLRRYSPARVGDAPEEQVMWEWMKQKARSAVFSAAADYHLSSEHYTWGTHPCAAMRMFMNKDHKFRLAMSPHFYRTAFTCAVSTPLLYKDKGLLMRLNNPEYEFDLENFEDAEKELQFKTLQEDLEDRGLLDAEGKAKCDFLALSSDAVDLHNVLTEYVNNLIDELYSDDEELASDVEMKKAYEYIQKSFNKTMKPNTPEKYKMPEIYNRDNMKKVWGEILWHVTGRHSSIGNVQAWGQDPCFINLRLRRPPMDANDEFPDLSNKTFRWDLVAPMESTLGVALISAFATMPSPTLSQNWDHVFTEDAFPNGVPRAYEKLKKDLEKLEEDLGERNESREFYVNDYLPSYCETSISG